VPGSPGAVGQSVDCHLAEGVWCVADTVDGTEVVEFGCLLLYRGWEGVVVGLPVVRTVVKV